MYIQLQDGQFNQNGNQRQKDGYYLIMDVLVHSINLQDGQIANNGNRSVLRVC